MARISTYDQDSNVSFQDKLIGTNSVDSATKNFTLQSVIDLINQLSGINLFDGMVYKFQSYLPAATDPVGILNLVAGNTSTTAFSAVTQIIVSKKVFNGLEVGQYLSSLNGRRFKITKQDDLNTFAVYRVTSVADFTNNRYLRFVVTFVRGNGSFTPNSFYFLTFQEPSFVVDFDDVSSAGSGQIITNTERTTLGTALQATDIIDNVTSTDINKALSANQGKILNDAIAAINTLLTSNDTNLDELQEIVNYIKLNRTTLNALSISSISGLQAALDAKVNVVTGKGLSENDFTNTLLTKLNGIATGAEVNVQSNWNETDTNDDSFIQNKPTDITDLSVHNVTELSDVSTTFFTGSTATSLTDAGSGSIITSAERTKLTGIDVDPANNTISDGTDSITVAPSSRTVQVLGTTNEVEVFPTGAQSLAADRIFTVGLPNDVTIGNDLNITGDATASSFVKSGGTGAQILLANGTVIDLTIESQGINNNDVDTKIPSNAAVKDAIDTAISNVIDNAPTALDTLNELAAALGDDANFSTTITTALGNRLQFDQYQALTSAQVTQVLNNLLITSTVQEINFLDGVTSTLAYKSHTVTVGSKTGGGNAYYVDGKERPILTVLPGTKYRFDLSSATLSSHPFKFSENENGATTGTYTANATYSGTPGSANAYAEITGHYQYPVLYYYCTVHSGMGNMVKSTISLEGFTPTDLLGTHSPATKTFIVTVAQKTTAHRYHNIGSGNGYLIDGVPAPYLTLTPGITYRFDVSHTSVASHPLFFYYNSDKSTPTGLSSNKYTTGVSDTYSTIQQGNPGAYIEIVADEDTPTVLHYMCGVHPYMGNGVNFNTRNLTDLSIDSLVDVDLTSVANDKILKYNSTSGKFEVADESGGTVTEAFKTIAVTGTSGQSDVVANLAADTLTFNAGSGMSITTNASNDTIQFASTATGGGTDLNSLSTAAVDVASDSIGFIDSSDSNNSKKSTIASLVSAIAGNNLTASNGQLNAQAGGGGGTVTVEKNVYTANGNTFGFATTTAIANENNVQVYIDGVYQSKDNYTTSGSTVTFSPTAPANGTSVELIHVVESSGVIARDTFTGNNTTTAFTLSMSISNVNATQVYIDGVYQSKSNYTTSGSVLTFNTAPATGTSIEVVHIKAVNATSINQNNFTGNGNQTFTLSQSIDDEAKTFVFIQGVYQEKSTYSISGNQITFNTAPQTGFTVEVMAFDSITVGNQTAAGTDWQTAIEPQTGTSFGADANKGYFVDTTSSSVTVNLPAGSVGDEIHFTDYAGNFDTNEIIFNANGTEKILGSTTNHKCVTKNATVRLIYQDNTNGWTADNIVIDPPATDVYYLVVAGGGGGTGGASGGGGGGGAGGYLTNFGGTALSLNPLTNINVTVGTGGSAGVGGTEGGEGTASSYGSISAAGGGGGGYGISNHPEGGDGGSGGGGGGNAGATAGVGGSGNTPSTTPSQGNDGGDSGPNTTHQWAGGGGGGIGSAGSNGAANNPGNGGTGTTNSITGASVTYAGGGGGGSWTSGTSNGTGGSGVGGNGGKGSSSPGADGSPLTGSGGGGGGQDSNGGAGSSGVVILRYQGTLSLQTGHTLVTSHINQAISGSSEVYTRFTSGSGNIQIN
tara:strand:- start:633 stop:5474 length:4842 start_codon:yes stop_codon:yes gene_type:complete